MRAEVFFYNLDILLIKKNLKKFSTVIFSQFLVMKALDPDWIRIGGHPKMLDPDPDP